MIWFLFLSHISSEQNCQKSVTKNRGVHNENTRGEGWPYRERVTYKGIGWKTSAHFKNQQPI